MAYQAMHSVAISIINDSYLFGLLLKRRVVLLKSSPKLFLYSPRSLTNSLTYLLYSFYIGRYISRYHLGVFLAPVTTLPVGLLSGMLGIK